MRRPRVLVNKKMGAAQKKLFSKIDKMDISFKKLCEQMGCAHSGLYDAKRLQRPLSPFDVVKLCNIVDGYVMPHELRPDIFGPELIKLYREQK